MSYIVFYDRPFCPGLEGEYETESEALSAAETWHKEKRDTDGHRNSIVYVAKVIRKIDAKTNY